MSAYTEKGLVFDSADNRLVGIAAIPEIPAETGIIILVGGPQYRVGSHRQFTLLARSLAEEGFPSLRFDYTGMGDSEGIKNNFQETGHDMAAAIEVFRQTVPGVSKVILWGLCDGASAAMMFARQHETVVGMILLNPWVHDGDYSPQVKLSHYYRPLLSEKHSWKRLFSGKVRLLPAFSELVKETLSFIGRRASSIVRRVERQSYVQEMLEGLRCFPQDVLIILSENDLTAREFSSLIEEEGEWTVLMSRSNITIHMIQGADHTFSRRPLQEEVSESTIEWVKSLV